MRGNTGFAKIICTIGPATWDPAVMRAIIDQGMDVARINGAFADQEEMLKVEKLVREVTEDVGLMIDIKGPEVRLNKFPEAIYLQKDQVLEIGSSDEFAVYPANYPDIYQKLKAGQIIMVGDGDVRFEVTEIKERSFMVKVIYGEALKPGKALNFPGAQLNDNPLTEQDKTVLKYAIEREWEYVSASFIRTKEDAEFIRGFLGDSKIELIAKIEDEAGVNNIDDILTAVDGVMVARGGLGVELGIEKVPIVQRRIIAAANAAGKPVITATQMLDRMEQHITPSRAEANDIATSILLGTDCIMLSGESSAGKYPIEAVEFMTKVDKEVRALVPAQLSPTTNMKVVSEAALAFSRQVFDTVMANKDLKAVLYFTDDNSQIGVLSRYALPLPIYTFAQSKRQARQMNLRRGITRSFATEQEFQSNADIKQYIYAVAKQLGIATTDDKLLLVSNFKDTGKFPTLFEIVSAG